MHCSILIERYLTGKCLLQDSSPPPLLVLRLASEWDSNKKRIAFARGYPQLIPLILLPRCVTPPTLSQLDPVLGLFRVCQLVPYHECSSYDSYYKQAEPVHLTYHKTNDVETNADDREDQARKRCKHEKGNDNYHNPVFTPEFVHIHLLSLV